MRSAYKVGDRVAMLYDGRILACDTPDRFRASTDPIVQQFVQGQAHGPIRQDDAEEGSLSAEGGLEA